MSALILPQKFKQQPQHNAPIDRASPLAHGLVSATVFDNAGSAFDRATGGGYPVTNGVHRIDKPGRVTLFSGTGYVNTGAQTVGGIDLFAHPASQWSAVIYARLESAGGTGTFIAKGGADPAARTLHLYSDGSASHFPAVRLRGALTVTDWGWSSADWHQYTLTWDGSVANLYGDYDKQAAIVLGSSAQEPQNIVFGARTGGAGGFLAGRLAYGYFFNRAISRAESITLLENPWQIFKAPPRRIWVASASPDVTLSLSGQSVASASGALSPSTAVALSGQQSGFSTGTLTPGVGVVVALSGQSLASAQGSLSPAMDIALSGQSLALSQGTTGISGDITVALTGIAIAASQGSLSLSAAQSTGGHFAGVGVIGRKRKKRELVDHDREEIKHLIRMQLDEAYAALFQPEIPEEVQEQAAAIIQQFQRPEIDFEALQQEAFQVKQMLHMWEQRARQKQIDEDEELLMMVI